MLSGNIAILGQVGAVLFLLIVGIIVVLVLGSGTSIGRAMLPSPVTDVVAIGLLDAFQLRAATGEMPPVLAILGCQPRRRPAPAYRYDEYAVGIRYRLGGPWSVI